MRLHNHLLRAARRAVVRKRAQALQPAQAIGEALQELNKIPSSEKDRTFTDLLEQLEDIETNRPKTR